MLLTHLPVVSVPAAPNLASNGPLGEFTWTSVVVAAEVHVSVVTPSPVPSQIGIGFGLALRLVPLQPAAVTVTLTLASVWAAVSGSPPETSCR